MDKLHNQLKGNVVDGEVGQTGKWATKFDPDTLKSYLRRATIMHSPSNSSDRISSISSSSSSISGVGDFVRRFFRGFFFDASASAFSTTSRISRVLKTNLPFTATLFPFVRSFRYRSISRCSSFSFRSSVTSVFDFSSVVVSRAIYRFAGDGRFDSFRTVLSSSSFTCRISVSRGGEDVRRVVSRAFRVDGDRGESRGGGGISRVERTVIGENGEIPIFRKPDRIEFDRKASSRAVIYAVVQSIFEIRPGSKRESRSVSRERYVFNGLKTATSRGCSICDEYSGNITRSIAYLRQNAINLAVRYDECPSVRRRRRRGIEGFVLGSNTVVSYSYPIESEVYPFVVDEKR